MTTQEYAKLYLSPKTLWFASSKMYLHYLWYYVPVDAIPFLFTGLQWNKFNFSNIEPNIFIPCFIVYYIVHFVSPKKSGATNISEKNVGLRGANFLP